MKTFVVEHVDHNPDGSTTIFGRFLADDFPIVHTIPAGETVTVLKPRDSA